VAPALTIFIDALPFDQLEKMEFSRTFASKARLRPILGYSVNCQTGLFTGKKPDDLGFWCEWTYAPERAEFRAWRPLLRLLSVAEISYSAKRAVHRVLDKFGSASSTKNIPLAYLADFAETGHSVFSPEFPHPSLLDHPGLTKFLHGDFPNTDRLDEVIFEAAKGYIETSDAPGHVLLTFVKIDKCSHWDGVGSPPYDAMLGENDRYIRELTEAYLRKHPDGVVLVVSDHGMANVERYVRVDLEGTFGKPRSAGYAYFSEGTIVRVWCADPGLRGRIDEYMLSFSDVEGVTLEEREEFGITRHEFGDLIYHTSEGAMFVPSFWGPKPSVGMHGHHPKYPGQIGLALSTRPGDFDGEIRAEDFYAVLRAHLEPSVG